MQTVLSAFKFICLHMRQYFGQAHNMHGVRMKQINIKNIAIGKGMPKICIPVVAKNIDEVKSQAEEIAALPVDLIELRGDFLENYLESTYAVDAIKEIKKIADVPVIYTFRTVREGGEQDISSVQYETLLKKILGSGMAELIDVEMFSGDDLVKDVIAYAHKCGTHVIVSNHDFENTPIKIEIISRLVKMQVLGADIAKIAVMPNSKEDVLTLLQATLFAYEQYMDIPVITMSMAQDGMISRMAGEIFGSCITFGAAKKASAPGQIHAGELAKILEIIHNSTK